MPVDVETQLETVLNELARTARGHRTTWGLPVPWAAEPVFASGFQVAPAYGAANQVIVATYIVPRGYTALLCGLVLDYAGSGSPALPGQILWSVDVNNPNAAVVSPQLGYTEKDYASVPFGLGAFSAGPVWPVEFRHDQNEQVRIKAQTVAVVAVGPGNFVAGALVGFQWPTMGWEG